MEKRWKPWICSFRVLYVFERGVGVIHREKSWEEACEKTSTTF